MRKTTPAFFIGVCFVASAVMAQSAPTAFSLTPTHARSDTAFSLWLLSENFDCATIFSNLNTVVDVSTGDHISSITLSFSTSENPSVKCSASPGAVYGPQFALPALPTQYFQVFYAPAGSAKVLVGTLRVGQGQGGWFLKPKRVYAARPFELQLLDEQYGNCGEGFVDTTVDVTRTGTIHLSALHQLYPGAECFADIHPWGPAFSMSGLPVGKYLVYYHDVLACEIQNPPCVPPYTEVLVDTLEVMASTALVSGERRKPEAVFSGRFFSRPFPSSTIHGYQTNGRKP